MATYTCGLCGYVYDEEAEGTPWADVPEDWLCPVCGSPKSAFEIDEPAAEAAPPTPPPAGDYLGEWRRQSDETERHMAAIHQMAEAGQSIVEPMRSRHAAPLWDDILVKGAQLARLPLNEEAPVSTKTVIGPGAQKPLEIETPVYVSHMSFGALSREAKLALARGSAAAQTAMCSGEGGILPESIESAYRYIFEIVPNGYSVTEENLRRADALEIKIGQSAKPGMGGMLPGNKVTEEIAQVRDRPTGQDVISPAHFPDIADREALRDRVTELRQTSEGRPVGIKIAAGSIEEDLDVALYAEPDFVTIDGRPGATGAAPKFIKDATSIPTVYALHRARRFLDEHGANHVSLVVTGGFRVSADIIKALAMGADAVAIATPALMAIGCQQYRICSTGKCPVGITSQDPELRARLDVELSAGRLTRFLNVVTEELRAFARLTGHTGVHDLSVADLCTTNSEISNHTAVQHV